MCRGTSPARSPPPPVGEKPKSTSHRGPDPQQRIRCEKLEGHGTTFTVRPRPHRAYPDAAVDRAPERRIGELSERPISDRRLLVARPLSRERGKGSPKWAGVNLRKTRGGSRHVADQLSEIGVRHAAAHTVEASRYCGQKLLVPLVLPVVQKALPTLRGRFGSPSRFCSRSWHFSVHPTCRGCRRGSRKSVSGKVDSRGRASPYVATAAFEASSRVA